MKQAKQVEAAQKHLESGTRVFQLSWSLGYIPNRLWLGLLRAAYLAVFHHYGYTYVLAPSVTPVRRQITGEDAPSQHLAGIVTELATPPLPPSYGLLAVDLGPKTGHLAHLVFLQTKMVVATTYAVLLPHAGPAEPDVLARLAGVAEAIKGSFLTLRLKGKQQ